MRQAVVLVGGRGTRLGALATSAPKPMLPIVGRKTFLDFLLENLARHGLDEIILLAGHLGEHVQQRYEGQNIRGARISVVIEASPSGTAGALSGVRDRLQDIFLMSNGDSILDMNYLSLLDVMTPTTDGAIALRRVDDVRRFGSIDLAGSRIINFNEKDETRVGPGLISGGVYLLRRSIMDRILTTPCSIEQEIFPALAAENRIAGLCVNGYFLDIGLPETLGQARKETPDALRRPAVFFDRDGTLNRDHGYTHRPEDLILQPGAAAAVRAVNDAGALAIVVTNQSGIARGYFNQSQMDLFHDALQLRLREEGAHIDAFYHSPFHEDGVSEELSQADHPDRKPRAGMLYRALQEWDIDPCGSLMVGDSEADVYAGKAAGIQALQVSPGMLLSAVKEHLGEPRKTVSASLAEAKRQLQERATVSRDWLFNRVLPFWSDVGFDRTTHTFHERVDRLGKPVMLPPSTRVQAHQIIAFSLAGRLGWTGPWRERVAGGAHALSERGIRAEGGINRFLDRAEQQPEGDGWDLHDTALVVWALSEAAHAQACQEWADKARSLADRMDAGYSDAAVTDKGARRAHCLPQTSVSFVHSLSAMLALYEATKDDAALLHAGTVAHILEQRFLAHRWGGLLSACNRDFTPGAGDSGRVVCPGRQFECVWTLEHYARVSSHRVAQSAERMFLHSEVYGVDRATGFTVDEIWVEGGMRDPCAHVWSQAERLKANLTRFEDTGSLTAARNALQAFDALSVFMATPIAGLWRGRRTSDGIFAEEDVDARSLYHVTSAIAELCRVSELS